MLDCDSWQVVIVTVIMTVAGNTSTPHPPHYMRPPASPFLQVTDFIRLPDSGLVSLYIARITLRGLAVQPLSGAPTSPVVSTSALDPLTASEADAAPQAWALPLWFVRTRAK